MTADAFIIDAVRTPFGRIAGALAGVRADDLAAGALRSLLDRTPALDAVAIDEIYMGDANQAGEDNRNVARMAALLAGLPTSVPGATVNRLCGSGMDAIFCASRTIAVGDADLAVAGGVESMSRAPWVLQKPAKGYPTGHEQLWSTTLGWRMTNPKMPKQWTVALGEGAELLADLHAIARDEQDEFALRSHRAAAAAWDAGWFDAEIVPVPGVLLARDECIRADTTLDKLASLPPVFRPDGGTVTAGNSSPMNDGASMLLLASAAGLETAGAAPMARIVSRATSGVDPHLFGIGPVQSVRIALERAGIGWGDLDAVELNEAFAAQSLACLREMPELDPSIVNAQGGAIAIGHPLGGSGARIVTTLVHRLRRTGGRYGLAAMCIGVGQGIAMVIENLGQA
ncbi:MAG: beta-ketoadipyl CoA thiolase [Ilumatobacteraceae bacterium]|nr:beta-ketoadipyl CoA thiolase [Ilumatobacteraceae bacterium]